MTTFRIRRAAELLGVSDDTLRRWVSSGRIPAGTDAAGCRCVDGRDLARLAVQLAAAPEGGRTRSALSARNRLTGLVTRVLREGLMAQVEMQCGPFRVVSVITREAADELGLEPGQLAVASVKATSVVVERAS